MKSSFPLMLLLLITFVLNRRRTNKIGELEKDDY